MSNKKDQQKGLKEVEEEMKKRYMENYENFIRKLYGLAKEEDEPIHKKL